MGTLLIILSDEKVVNIGLQLPPPEQRIVAKFNSSVTFWQMLKDLEKDKGVNLTRRSSSGFYLQPTLTYVTREVCFINFQISRRRGRFDASQLSTNRELRRMSLSSLGLISGNKLVKVTFKETEVPVDKFLEEDAQACCPRSFLLI